MVLRPPPIGILRGPGILANAPEAQDMPDRAEHISRPELRRIHLKDLVALALVADDARVIILALMNALLADIFAAAMRGPLVVASAAHLTQ